LLRNKEIADQHAEKNGLWFAKLSPYRKNCFSGGNQNQKIVSKCCRKQGVPSIQEMYAVWQGRGRGRGKPPPGGGKGRENGGNSRKKKKPALRWSVLGKRSAALEGNLKKEGD